MCRKNIVLGAALIAGGAGFLLSLLFGSDFIKAIIGVALAVAGFLLLRS